MHIVLIAANASGIIQETKVGKEIILIIIEASGVTFNYGHDAYNSAKYYNHYHIIV